MSRLLLLLLALCMPSCAYFRDRGIDFVDQFKVRLGVGTPIGVRGRALGLVDTGLMIGVKPRISSIGLDYSTLLFLNQGDALMDTDQAELIKATSVKGLSMGDGSYQTARNSVALLPALFTWTDATPTEVDWVVPEEGDTFKDQYWLWDGETFKHNRYAQIHAFDIEIGVGLFLYADAGYSPGETVDFLLGIFGIDIAKDDGKPRAR